jgi:hypothetical protein
VKRAKKTENVRAKKVTRRVAGPAAASKNVTKSPTPSPMMTERLIEHRTATLDIYRRLAQARANAGKEIPETVARSQQNLDQNRFLLAIVGKVKAGKSTFINALLKKDLLPTDALQATSAIIEISHAERPYLRVTYANGATEETGSPEGDENLAPLTQKLREVAAIRAEERDLPIAQLNDFIIEHFDCDLQKAEWDSEVLELFLQSDLPNIHNIAPSELQQRSRAYLDHHRDGKKIAKRVEVGYPSAYQFDHFRIVDTPGICAKGGFAERTLEFLINADGVIYLHKEEPAEETLHDALQNVIPEKAKKHMLLVLTHKSQRTKEATEKYLSEAKKCCSQIPEERIFIVDSLTEIILQNIYGKNLSEIKDICGQNEEWINCIAKPFMSAMGVAPEFFELLEKQSNMDSLRLEIGRMSEKSLGIQIETVLDAIQELYSELEADAAARRSLYGKRLKDPQQFAAEMARQMDEIDRLQADSSKRVSDIQKEFNLESPNQKFGKALKKNVDEAVNEINGKQFNSGDTAKTAYNFLTKINQDFEDSLQELLNDIKSNFQRTISEMETSLQSEFDITVPKIPLTELLAQLRTEATKTVTVTVKKTDLWSRFKQFISPESWEWGTETKEERRFDAESYFSAAKSKVRQKFLDRKQNVAESVKANIQRTCDEYRAAVGRKLDERRQLFEALKGKKQENDAVQKSFEEESRQVEAARLEIAECTRIRGDL